MGLFRKLIDRKSQKKKKSGKGQVIAQPVVDKKAQQSQEELEEKERKQKQMEEAYRLQQEASEQELEKLDSQVDDLLSTNSEEFMHQVKQPGGE